MDWNCSVAAHGESLEHVPRGFLISRCKGENDHITEQLSTQLFFHFWRTWGLWEALEATDLRDCTLFYCTCHLFSLALGMFAMVTAHSGLVELTHAVLCISRLGCDEGKSLPMIPNPWWGRFSITAPGSTRASHPSLLLCHPHPAPTKGILSKNKLLFSKPNCTRLPKFVKKKCRSPESEPCRTFSDWGHKLFYLFIF